MPNLIRVSICVTLALSACAHTPQTKVRKLHYPSGALQLEMETISQIPVGRATRYFPNGEIESLGFYRAGKRDGLFHYWDNQGNWLRQELYRDNIAVWGSSDRSEHPVEQDSPADPVAQNTAIPTFSGLSPLALQDGIALRASYQQIERNGFKSRAHHLQLAVSHHLRALGLPSLRLYGALATTTMDFDSEEFPALQGKRSLELGGSWLRNDALAVAAGLVLPVGEDTLEGYRTASATSQLALDSAAAAYPRSTALRAKTVLAGQWHQWFYRGDAGIDLVLDTQGNDQLRIQNSPVFLLQTGASIGIRTTRFFLSAQLRTRRPLGDNAREQTTNTAITAEVTSYTIRPAITVYAPVLGEQKSPGLAISLTYNLDD